MNLFHSIALYDNVSVLSRARSGPGDQSLDVGHGIRKCPPLSDFSLRPTPNFRVVEALVLHCNLGFGLVSRNSAPLSLASYFPNRNLRCVGCLLKNTKSEPDRNVRPTFFNDPEASGGTDISVCAFFNRLLVRRLVQLQGFHLLNGADCRAAAASF